MTQYCPSAASTWVNNTIPREGVSEFPGMYTEGEDCDAEVTAMFEGGAWQTAESSARRG